MKNKLKELIEMYKKRCKLIEAEWCTIDKDGEPVFSYDCDFDDQCSTAEAESEYYTLLGVIDELESLID